MNIAARIEIGYSWFYKVYYIVSHDLEHAAANLTNMKVAFNDRQGFVDFQKRSK